MPFLTDLTTDDVVTLKNEDTDSVVRLRVSKKSGAKVRLSIDAGKEIRIKKIVPMRNRRKNSGKNNKHGGGNRAGNMPAALEESK